MSSTVEKQGDKRAALSSDMACKRRKKNAPAMDYEITDSSPTSEAASVPSEPEHIPPPAMLLDPNEKHRSELGVECNEQQQSITTVLP
jgi:hypothetical protein